LADSPGGRGMAGEWHRRVFEFLQGAFAVTGRQRSLLVLLLLLAATAAPRAQDAAGDVTAAGQAIQNQADPGQIEKRIKERGVVPPSQAPDLPALPEPAPTVSEDEGTFLLTGISVTGATVFSETELAPFYEEFLGKEITLGAVEEILSRLTQLYRDTGYILSRAVAPPQDLADGMLQVRIVEGFVEKLTLEGEVPDRRRVYRHGRQIMETRPLYLGRLERHLLLINDLPGISVSPSLRPIDEANGRYELILALDHDPADATVYGDNRGTPAVGRLQTWLSGGLNSAFGASERLQLGFFTVPNEPDELRYFELVYDQPVDSNGTYLRLSASHSDVDASDDLRVLEAESESRVFSLQLRHALLRSRKQNLWLAGIFDYRDVNQDLLGTRLYEDRLRVLRLRGNYNLSDEWSGTNFAQLEVSRGLPVFGASSEDSLQLSRSNGESGFTKISGSLRRQQPLGDSFGVILALAGQGAADPLLSSEEFAVGGAQFGRGYDYSEITGEHGLAGSVELLFGEPLDWYPLQSYQIYGFADMGAVWNKLPGGGTSRDSVASAGGGLRLTLLDTVRASFEVARPLTRRPATEASKEPRFFVTLSATF